MAFKPFQTLFAREAAKVDAKRALQVAKRLVEEAANLFGGAGESGSESLAHQIGVDIDRLLDEPPASVPPPSQRK